MRNLLAGGGARATAVSAQRRGDRAPHSEVEAGPPRSGVRSDGCASTSSIARITAAAASWRPKWESIIEPAQIWPTGLAMPRPAMSGAEP